MKSKREGEQGRSAEREVKRQGGGREGGRERGNENRKTRDKNSHSNLLPGCTHGPSASHPPLAAPPTLEALCALVPQPAVPTDRAHSAFKPRHAREPRETHGA